jgi:lysophospholipase L1-like esterase
MRMKFRHRPAFLISIFLRLFLLACTASAGSNAPMPDSPKTIRYLALGDSYTVGESVDEAERWPNQLAMLLNDKNYHTEVTIIARTGWTTDELWKGIQDQDIALAYDLVSLLIGVNDQYRGRSLDEYREQFRFLLDKAIEYANSDATRVIVISIPDWSVTPFAQGDRRSAAQIADEIDRFNAVNQDEALKTGAHYVDITPSSRSAKDDAALLASDGLHPSGKMYAGWVEKIFPVVLEILQR